MELKISITDTRRLRDKQKLRLEMESASDSAESKIDNYNGRYAMPKKKEEEKRQGRPDYCFTH